MKRLIYLTLEAPREGQASYTHIHEIIAGLQKLEWEITLFQPPYAAKDVSPGLFLRLVHAIILQIRLWTRWQRGAALYVRGHYLAFPSALLARIFGIRIFHEINGPYEDVFISHPSLNPLRPVLIWIQRQQYRWATGLIAVTDGLCAWADRVSGKPAGSCRLIPNGANTMVFHPDVPVAQGLPERYVIFFGGLARWHGVPVMVEAMHHAAWPEDVHLVVIGEGQCSEMVRHAAVQDPRIHMLGRMANRDVPPYVAGAIAGLVPITNPGQRSESGLMPLKMLETLACSVPVIVTDFPGQAELVRSGECGLVIAPDDAAALAQAVAQLAADSTCCAAMGQRGRTLVAARHSWDARAAATEAFIAELLRGRTTAGSVYPRAKAKSRNDSL